MGIDISKSFFDAALPVEGSKYRHLQLCNDEQGFAQLLVAMEGAASWEGAAACHVVMEASGPYYLRLASFLHGKGALSTRCRCAASARCASRVPRQTRRTR